MTRVHELKTVQPWFEALWDGLKTMEIRFNDRDYQAGDILVLREYCEESQAFKERSIVAVAATVWGKVPGLQEGCVLIGLQHCKLLVSNITCWAETKDDY